MVSDFAPIAPLPCPSKKKRTNRLAKLEQSKLDVRREQWLSQVNNKDCKLNLNGSAASLSPPFTTKRIEEQKKSLRNSETNSREEETEHMSIHDSDLESLMNSPIQTNNDSKEASSSSSSDSSSGNVSEEDKDGCLDSWEDVADALSVDDVNKHYSPMNSPAISETMVESDEAGQQLREKGMVYGSRTNCRAWRLDDVSRPQTLPILSKQHDIYLNRDWCNENGTITWEQRRITMAHPSSCPVCFEDLDATDSSFLPCPCGFRLCLFCHKRILEVDGRCPGCRKHYDSINRKYVTLDKLSLLM